MLLNFHNLLLLLLKFQTHLHLTLLLSLHLDNTRILLNPPLNSPQIRRKQYRMCPPSIPAKQVHKMSSYSLVDGGGDGLWRLSFKSEPIVSHRDLPDVGVDGDCFVLV